VKNREDLGPMGHLQSFPNVKNKRKHKVLFIGWQVTGVRLNALPAFERTTYVRTHQLFVVERKACVRSQITAVAARADWACVRTQITARAGWACVRPLLMRVTVGAFERTQVRSNALGRNQLLHLVHFAFC
jgi:hypothetical protein